MERRIEDGPLIDEFMLIITGCMYTDTERKIVGDKLVEHKLNQNLSKVPHVIVLLDGTSTQSHMSPQYKLAFRHHNVELAYH